MSITADSYYEITFASDPNPENASTQTVQISGGFVPALAGPATTGHENEPEWLWEVAEILLNAPQTFSWPNGVVQSVKYIAPAARDIEQPE